MPYVLRDSLNHIAKAYGIHLNEVKKCTIVEQNNLLCLEDLTEIDTFKLISVYNPNIKPMKGLFLSVKR